MFFPQSRKHSSSKMIQHVLINTIIFISIEQVVGLALMAGADGEVAHPVVRVARAAQAQVNLVRAEGPRAQETGVHQVLQTGEVVHPRVRAERVARAQVNLGRAEAPQVQEIGGHQVLQTGVDGVHHPVVRVERVARGEYGKSGNSKSIYLPNDSRNHTNRVTEP